jgi:nucleoid DNA-binding protein
VSARVNQLTLANIIREVLPEIKRDPANRIVKTISNAIIKGLRAGEDVTIDGFGIFRLATYPSRQMELLSLQTMKRYKTTVPTKRKVKFLPSKVLIKLVTPEANP